MNNINTRCPGCGAEISINKDAYILTCKYCNSILEQTKGVIDKIGDQNDFIDFPSIFEVGKNIDFKGKKYYITGEVRYEYSGGFFSKFYTTNDGKNYVIRSDDGENTITNERILKNTGIDLENSKVGMIITFGEQKYLIKEIGEAFISGIKGYFKTPIKPLKKVLYLDGAGKNKQIFLEQSSEKNEVILGETIL